MQLPNSNGPLPNVIISSYTTSAASSLIETITIDGSVYTILNKTATPFYNMPR